MNKSELEDIALGCLERLEAEAKAARQHQDEKIRRLENKVNDYEMQLTRLSGLYRRLESFTEKLNTILSDRRF